MEHLLRSPFCFLNITNLLANLHSYMPYDKQSQQDEQY